MLWLRLVATWWSLGFWHHAVHMGVRLDLTSKIQLRSFQTIYLRRAIRWDSLIYQNESVHSFIRLQSLVWLGSLLALFKVVCRNSCLKEKKEGGFHHSIHSFEVIEGILWRLIWCIVIFFAILPFRLSVAIPSVSTNALGYGAFLGLYANLRYQLLYGLDQHMVKRFEVLGVAIFFSTAAR